MKIFSIVGWSGSGKTTLITGLIKRFVQKKKKVAAVKNVPHKYYLEPESSDTFRFLDAGAEEACLTASNELLFIRKNTAPNNTLSFLEKRYSDCDFLLLEGFRDKNIPLIEVFDSTLNNLPKFEIETLAAVVSDMPLSIENPTKIPVFNRNDIDGIINYLEDYP